MTTSEEPSSGVSALASPPLAPSLRVPLALAARPPGRSRAPFPALRSMRPGARPHGAGVLCAGWDPAPPPLRSAALQRPRSVGRTPLPLPPSSPRASASPPPPPPARARARARALVPRAAAGAWSARAAPPNPRPPRFSAPFSLPADRAPMHRSLSLALRRAAPLTAAAAPPPPPPPAAAAPRPTARRANARAAGFRERAAKRRAVKIFPARARAPKPQPQRAPTARRFERLSSKIKRQLRCRVPRQRMFRPVSRARRRPGFAGRRRFHRGCDLPSALLLLHDLTRRPPHRRPHGPGTEKKEKIKTGGATRASVKRRAKHVICPRSDGPTAFSLAVFGLDPEFETPKIAAPNRGAAAGLARGRWRGALCARAAARARARAARRRPPFLLPCDSVGGFRREPQTARIPRGSIPPGGGARHRDPGPRARARGRISASPGLTARGHRG